MGQWVAAVLTYALVFAPRTTRVIASIFAMITLSDFLHLLYAATTALQKLATKRAE